MKKLGVLLALVLLSLVPHFIQNRRFLKCVFERILVISIALCLFAGTISPGLSLQYSAEINIPIDFDYIENKLASSDSSVSETQKGIVQDFLLQQYGSITVLNEQSYPTVGQYWIIDFTTQGTHDLKISAVNGTLFGNTSPYDVEFVELYDGTSYLQPQMVDGKIMITDYSSQMTGQLKLKVHTEGSHHIMFEFGQSVAYAHNSASPKSTTKIASGTTNFVTLTDNDQFGSSVAIIGDIDGDGIQDIAAGAPGDDTGGGSRGTVYIILMNANGTPKSTTTIASGTANGPTLANGDTFGASVAGIGDLDRDGIPDIAVGAANDVTGGSARGAVYIILMNADGTPKSTSKIASGTANGPTLVDLSTFGNSVAGIGDIDGDGILDIAAGAVNEDTARGVVYIILMNANGTPKLTTKIASGTTNFVTLATFDLFGASVVGIGDIDRDGIPDIAAGAPGDDTGGGSRGTVYIILMNANGTPKSTTTIESGTTNGPTLANGDAFGASVAGIGDLDRDGIPDIAAGADFDDTGGSARGAVHIILMNADGTPKSTSKIASGTTNFVTLTNIDTFGNSVAGLGDLDGDGVLDIAVGADGDDTGGSARGAVYILPLTGDFPEGFGLIDTTTKIASDTANFVTLVDNDNFGNSVAGIGDIDGDGVQDIAAGAAGDDTGGSGKGAVYIILMNSDGTPKSTTKIADGTANFVTLRNNDRFGISVAGIGDLDRDGIPDIAAGADNDDTGGNNRGTLYIILMKADGTPKSTITIESGTAGFVTLSDNDSFGNSVTEIGDLDGDGVQDIAAGAAASNTDGAFKGAVYIILMNANGTPKSTTQIASGTANFVTLSNFDFFGVSVAGIGDIDRDGIPDIAASSHLTDTGGNNRGAVYIILMNANGTPKSTTTIESGTANGPTLIDNDEFGVSVAGIGDIDRDGIPDIAAGADEDDTGGTDRGAVYIILMNANGTPKSTKKIASGTTNFVTLADDDNFGRTVAVIGDINRDGIQDIVVSGTLDDTGGANRGAVYIIQLHSNIRSLTAFDSPTISDSAPFLPTVSVSPIAAITDGVGDFTVLDDALGITTTTIDSIPYALVASEDDDSVTIIDISTPSSPTFVAAITNNVGDFTELNRPQGITTTTIDSIPYALVASKSSDSVTIIDISTPSSPTLVAEIVDGVGDFTALDGPQDITTITIGSIPYALVTSDFDDSVTIIDISTPSSPTLVAELLDDEEGGDFTTLDDAQGITTITIGSIPYALVASEDDDGVTIIDISTPSSPTAVATITDNTGGFTALNGAFDITTITIGSIPYALVHH